MNPLISVILPVFNSEKYLKESIESILNQSYSNFEFLIYNDGSSDSSLNIIRSYDDSRIIVKSFNNNVGLISLLNIALQESKGKYIARMDADDISSPERFSQQVKFLEENPEIGICGSYIKIIESDEIILKPTTDNDLRWWIFKGSPFAHPSIMLRKVIIERTQLKFNPKAYVVEDFEFWWQLAFHTKLANLDQVLLHYRVHENQESTSKKEIQYLNYRKSQANFICSLGINSNIYYPEFIEQLLTRNLECSADNFIKSWNFFNDMLDENQAITFFGIDSIESKLASQIQFILQNMTQFNVNLLKYIFDKKFRQLLSKSNISIMTFSFKSLINWKTKRL